MGLLFWRNGASFLEVGGYFFEPASFIICVCIEYIETEWYTIEYITDLWSNTYYNMHVYYIYIDLNQLNIYILDNFDALAFQHSIFTFWILNFELAIVSYDR